MQVNSIRVVAVSTAQCKFTQSVGRSLTAGDDVFMNDQVETGEATRSGFAA